MERIAEACGLKVRTYDLDPTVFLMILGESVFTEQYHQGRPKNHPFGSCIGKYVSVFEYALHAQTATFLLAHYDSLWDSASDSDRTLEIVRTVGAQMPADP